VSEIDLAPCRFSISPQARERETVREHRTSGEKNRLTFLAASATDHQGQRHKLSRVEKLVALREFDSQRTENDHAHQKPAVSPASYVGRAIGAGLVAEGDIHDLHVESRGAKQ